MTNKTPHPTKRGPGRVHGQGVKHPKAPATEKGAPLGFVQRINPKRQELRAAFIREHGVRQWKRMDRQYRRLAETHEAA